MRNVYVVCEGQTESNFVNRVLIPAFCDRINLIPRTVVTSTSRRNGRIHKGGMSSYGKAFNTIENSLKDAVRHDGLVTTMFDFYALPGDTPGVNDCPNATDVYQRISQIENAMIQGVCKRYQHVYHPYIQLHEFEALVFCNLVGLGAEYFESNINELYECLRTQPNPELINNGVETSPSKRIFSCIPDYDKVDIGVKVTADAGLAVLRKACRHFGEWIDFLETLL